MKKFKVGDIVRDMEDEELSQAVVLSYWNGRIGVEWLSSGSTGNWPVDDFELVRADEVGRSK